MAFSGSSSHDLALVVSVSQPGSSSYMGTALSQSALDAGGNSCMVPSTLYAVQILSVLRSSRPSRMVTARSVTPLTMTASLRRTVSSQPQLRGRPVVAPNSIPLAWKKSESSWSSVGMGPAPTLVVYALQTPTTFWTACGGRPHPVQAPPAVVFDEVTNG